MIAALTRPVEIIVGLQFYQYWSLVLQMKKKGMVKESHSKSIMSHITASNSHSCLTHIHGQNWPWRRKKACKGNGYGSTACSKVCP